MNGDGEAKGRDASLVSLYPALSFATDPGVE
jgi:hypothetical protein